MCDMNEVTKLDARILQLQKKILQMDAGCRELDHRLVSVETQLQSNAISAWKDNGPSDDELIEHVVQAEINKKTEIRTCKLVLEDKDLTRGQH